MTKLQNLAPPDPAGEHATGATQTDPSGYFSLDRRHGRWWFIAPDGEPFFSLGLNHIDPASLRYPENIHIWQTKYGAAPPVGSANRSFPTSPAGGSIRWDGFRK